MSDNQVGVAVPVNADDLLQQLLRDMPELMSVRDQLDLVVRVYAQYALQSGMDPKQALSEMEVFLGVNREGLISSVADINRVVLELSIRIAEDYAALTGSEIDPKILDIDNRYHQERQEQHDASKLARELLEMVKEIREKLGLRDLYEEAKAAMAEQKQAGFMGKLQQRAIKAGLLRVTEQEATQPEVDWLTPMILSGDNPSYAEVQKRLHGIVIVMKRTLNQESVDWSQAVLATLKNLKLDGAQLEQLLKQASELAYQQLDQSKVIMLQVDEDRREFAARIKILQDLKAIYGTVLKFFQEG